jgi:hypothetical protein
MTSPHESSRDRQHRTPIDAVAKKCAGWREHGILVVAEQDSCLTPPERKLIGHLGAKLYGARAGSRRMAERPALAQHGLKNPPGRAGFSWLDDKMAAFGNGKLVPPVRVLTNNLSETLEGRLHRRITEQILREAGIEERVAAALQKLALPVPEELREAIGGALLDQPEASWRAAIERVADQLLAAQHDGRGLPEHGA